MPRDSRVSHSSLMKITVEFTDVEILEVSDLKHTITMKMHLGAHWKEPRLVSLDTHGKGIQIPLDIRLLDHLWLPDLDIYNVKEIREFTVLKKLAGKKLNSYTMYLLAAHRYIGK